MKINKKLKVAILGVLGVFLLLFVVLVVHIASVKPVDNASLQISRIDFDAPLSPQEVKEIHRNLKSIPGVVTDHFNAEKGVLVYWHDNQVTDSKKVYTALMEKGIYNAKRFEVPKDLASKQVCPVMDRNSFSYKFSRGIQRLFN